MFSFPGTIRISFTPKPELGNTLVHVDPPSKLRYTPLFPPAKKSRGLLGLTSTALTPLEKSNPIDIQVQFCPPSILLYTSPGSVPQMTVFGEPAH